MTGDALREGLRECVVVSFGKPFKSRDVKFVGGLPRTRNAKVMGRVIRAGYLGEEPGDLSSFENP